MAVVRDRPKIVVAWSAAQALASAGVVGKLSQLTGLPPARSDLLSRGATDPTMSVFYQAAIIGRNWFDFDSARTKTIFEQMVNSVLTGRSSSVQAASEANKALEDLVTDTYGQ